MTPAELADLSRDLEQVVAQLARPLGEIAPELEALAPARFDLGDLGTVVLELEADVLELGAADLPELEELRAA